MEKKIIIIIIVMCFCIVMYVINEERNNNNSNEIKDETNAHLKAKRIINWNADCFFRFRYSLAAAQFICESVHTAQTH